MDRLGDWVKRGLWFIAIGAVAYIGERGNDGGFIKDLWAGAKTASPFAAMLALFLLFDERRERRDAQKQCNERTINFIESTNMQTNAADKTAGAVRQIADAMSFVGGFKKQRGRSGR